jgi:hypothetical protein
MDAVVYGKVAKLEGELTSLKQTISDLKDQISNAGTKLIEIEEYFSVPANNSLKKTILVGVDKFEIRTLFGKNTTNTNPFTVKIYDKDVLGFKVYESMKATEVYDIVAIPTSDKDATESMYVEVVNNGLTDAVIQVKITVTSLK